MFNVRGSQLPSHLRAFQLQAKRQDCRFHDTQPGRTSMFLLTKSRIKNKIRSKTKGNPN